MTEVTVTVSNSKEIINTFVSESHDLLDDAEARLSGLEEKYNSEIVNTVFRIFHSIKGSAGCLNFTNIKEITHEAETLLAIYREKQIAPSQEEVDLLYQTCDYIRQLVVNIDSFLTDEGFEKETAIIINSIKDSIRNLGSEMKSLGGTDSSRESKDDEDAAFADLVTPDIIERFLTESCDLLDECEIIALGLEKNPEQRELVSDVFRNIHSIKGNAGFLHLDRVEQSCVDIELFLEGMRENKAAINRNVIDYLLSQLDSLGSRVAEAVKKDGLATPAAEPAKDRKIGKILIDMGQIKEDDLREALNEKNGRTGEILVEQGKITRATLVRALKEQKSIRENAGTVSRAARRDIRVSTEKLDRLFDLMGELITAQAMVLYNPQVRGIASEDFSRTKNYLEKITRELHEITLGVRMIPLDGLFNKMYRVVRDLSRKAGKNVFFRIAGADAEMDRNVIEEIADPLIHILRNAVDHGLESETERECAGKEKTGNIHLCARYVGSEVWISVKDDGRGLSREKITDKARKLGLLNHDSDSMPDKAVWDLVFIPGFSTAEKVTNISGRGVGMEVVKKNIEKLNGSVEVKSESGRGTEITLKIPLTVAVVDAVIAKVGKCLYAIPSLEIFKFVKADPARTVELEGGHLLYRLRDENIPLVRLSSLFETGSAEKNFSDCVVIVIRKEEKKLCLLIDEIYSSQQIVVKSIADSVGACRGISGFSILANGDVSLILDVKETIDLYLH